MGELAKLVVIGVVAYVVWQYGKRVFGVAAAPPPAAPGPAPGAKRVEDMVKCPCCQTYVSAAAGACIRPDCPRRG